MKASCAVIVLAIGSVSAARRKLSKSDTPVNLVSNSTISASNFGGSGSSGGSTGDSNIDLSNVTYSDAPLCAKTAKCTNPKWKASECDLSDVDFPGFDVAKLKSNDLNKTGLYDVINCGNYTDQVIRLITDAQAAAQDGLKDSLAAGTNSKFGFKAFFKSNSSIGPVSEILDLVKNGTVPFQDGCFGGERPAAICVNNNAGIPSSLREACTEIGPVLLSTDYPSAMIICPDLLLRNWHDLIDLRAKCPSVQSNGKLVDDGSYENTTEILTSNALISIYLGDSFDDAEIDDVATAISYDQDISIYSSSNYALYMNAISKQCTSWPK